MKPALAKTPSLEKVLHEIELPRRWCFPIWNNRDLLNEEALKVQSNNLGQRISGFEEQAYREAGKEFNLVSTKDLRAIFFDEMEIAGREKTPGGQPSTDESVLQEWPIIMNYQKFFWNIVLWQIGVLILTVCRSKYRKRVVCILFHQALTSTGRLSSADPNLQNIPIKPMKVAYQNCFCRAKGYQLLAVDYSQIELRIMAYLSEDKYRLQLENGEDIHSVTAAEVFAEPGEEVTAEQRRGAKAINFGLIYGMSAFGLSSFEYF